MTQNESGRLPGKGEQRQATQVDPGWHQHSAKEQRRRVVSKKTQRVGWLIPREDKVDGVDDQCGEKDALGETPPSAYDAMPGAPPCLPAVRAPDASGG